MKSKLFKILNINSLRNCFFIFLTVALFGCETTEKIDDFPLRPSRMVVNCFFNADSIWEFQVSKSLSVLDNADIKLIKNATIELFKEGVIMDTLKISDTDGWYRANTNLPAEGKEFSIKVTSPGFKSTLIAKDVVPQKVVISNVDLTVTDSLFYRGNYYNNGFLKGSFGVSFSDPKNIDNYYQIKVFSWDSIFYFYPEGPEFIRLNKNYLSISSDDASITTKNSEYKSSLLLNDYLLDGRNYTLSVQFEDWDAKLNKQYLVELISLTRSGYLYQKSIEEYYRSKGDPFSEPVIIFSNIENGYGIFSSYSRFVYTFTTPF